MRCLADIETVLFEKESCGSIDKSEFQPWQKVWNVMKRIKEEVWTSILNLVREITQRIRSNKFGFNRELCVSSWHSRHFLGNKIILFVAFDSAAHYSSICCKRTQWLECTKYRWKHQDPTGGCTVWSLQVSLYPCFYEWKRLRRRGQIWSCLKNCMNTSFEKPYIFQVFHWRSGML